MTMTLANLIMVGAGCANTATDETAVQTGTPAATVENTRESLEIKGSDTSVQLVANLVESFDTDRGSNISVTGGGSGVGLAALLNKEISIANSSRRVTPEERSRAADSGLDLKEFVIARDGLSVIVNPANGVSDLTLDQVSGIYRGQIVNWREVGGPDAAISLYGRQETSGTHTFFREVAVKGDYAPTMRSLEGNQAIAEAVGQDVNGIGYVGVGYVRDDRGNVRDDVKIVPITLADGSQSSPLDEQDVMNGSYPLARPIYQYLSTVPPAGSLTERFLRFEISDQGQKISEQSGFFRPAAPDMVQNQSLFDLIK